MGFFRHHYVHPSKENPPLWAAMRIKCWRQWGEHCLYRDPMFGIQCGRTWNDRVPWTFRGKTKLNADHIFPAFTYPKKRWDPDNLQTLCMYHNERKGIRGHIDYRPGHYHRGRAVTLWWLLLPFHIFKWLVT